jgi:redox-sensitive bicupin YhaK (pirin superfamily)
MLIESRPVKLTTRTGIEVRRTLPHRDLKMIGAWCFVDHFGPTPQTDGMVVAAHPHTGLQTVTWLLEGAIEHRDSIGSVQRIEPGQLNLMTAGHGISHSELSLRGPQNLHAVQLWVALPEASRDIAPAFEHRHDLPKFDLDGGTATVLLGTFMGRTAKTTIFSEMVGVELRLAAGAAIALELEPNFEYGILPVEGSLVANGEAVSRSALKYLPISTDALPRTLHIQATEPTTFLLLGGRPFGEKILMWWNFIARTNAEIAEQRQQWNDHLENPTGRTRFGEFEDQIGGWIPAPELPNINLTPR